MASQRQRRLSRCPAPLPGGVTPCWVKTSPGWPATPVQSPKMLRKVEYSSATMTCRIDANTYIHWYQQRPGQPLQRMLYVSGETPTYDHSFPSWKFKVQKHPREGLYTLKKHFSGSSLCCPEKLKQRKKTR
uniref:Immunoglobulin V-set domain-containing protein n=1 Tax=Nothoprocta perdicaria TaxID=30464 RepID=A0A8C6ZYM3_NOTPE